MTVPAPTRPIRSGRRRRWAILAHPALVDGLAVALLLAGLATGRTAVSLVAAGAGAGTTLSGSV